MQQLVGFTPPHLLTTANLGSCSRFDTPKMIACMLQKVSTPVKQMYRGPLQRGAKDHMASDSHSTQPFTRTPLEKMYCQMACFEICQEYVCQF